MQTEDSTQAQMEWTGRYVLVFREGAGNDALAVLDKSTGARKSRMLSSADFGDGGVDLNQLEGSDGIVFEQLGIAVVSIEQDQASLLGERVGEDSSILSLEPEGVMHILSEGGLSPDYLRGFRDAATILAEKCGQKPIDAPTEESAASFFDTENLTWGLQATRVGASRFSGRGVRVAVLDTGLDLLHPDFTSRSVVSKSFLSGVVSAQDGHGHGTHCVGTACGPLQPNSGRRYGVAHRSQIYVGKVLSDAGRGGDAGILAGIEWALSNRCHVVSMSLGAEVCTTSVAYETAGQRALNAGMLIVAAAGNNSRRTAGQIGCVNRPANSRSFMAVGALDQKLKVADFSAGDTSQKPGTSVDIAGPGVGVYSGWPMTAYSRSISGTSMATPHVAGIAALWAEATNSRGGALWQRVIANAQTLPGPYVDVGRGLVIAP